MTDKFCIWCGEHLATTPSGPSCPNRCQAPRATDAAPDRTSSLPGKHRKPRAAS